MLLLYRKPRRMQGIFALLAALLIALPACAEEAETLQRLRFTDYRMIAFQGQTVFPQPDYYPDINPVFRWESGNPFVAEAGEDGGILCREVGDAMIYCTAQDGSNREAKIRLVVEPQIPVCIEEVKPQRGHLVMTVKSRMWETLTQGMTLAYTYLDAEENELGSGMEEVTGFRIFAAKHGEIAISPEMPEGASALRIRVTQIRNWQMSYDIPDAGLPPEEMNRGSIYLYVPEVSAGGS